MIVGSGWRGPSISILFTCHAVSSRDVGIVANSGAAREAQWTVFSCADMHGGAR
jgi:hypothetical protein